MVGSRAKTSHVSRRICLSPGQVNQAVSSALFYFRWDSNTAARQFNNYQPSKYNSCISHLSFRQVIKSVTYQQCLLRWLLYWNTFSKTWCPLMVCQSSDTLFTADKHTSFESRWDLYIHYKRGMQRHNLLYRRQIKHVSSYRTVVTQKLRQVFSFDISKQIQMINIYFYL